ncbi:MAG: hypothetical protein IJ398_04845 [Clostridia bacterium]|nr:hypothetical protein [Clostridia bacterium]
MRLIPNPKTVCRENGQTVFYVIVGLEENSGAFNLLFTFVVLIIEAKLLMKSCKHNEIHGWQVTLDDIRHTSCINDMPSEI